MVLSLSKLIGAYRFEWKPESLGNVLVHNLTVSSESILHKAFDSYIEADSKEFVRILITTVCQLNSNDAGEYTDDRVSSEQSNLLNDDELNDFAEKFLNKNSYLKNDQSKSKSKKKKKKNGEEVTLIEYEKRADAERLEGESYCDLLKRLMHHYRKYQDEERKKLFDSLKPKRIFSDSLLDLIGENRKLSDSLGSTINRYESFRPIEMPEDPLYETNRQLRSLGKEFTEVSSLVKNMNDLGLQMALEMASSSKTTKYHNTIMIVIGLVTLIFSAAMSYLSYVSSNEASKITQDILINSNAERMSIAKEHQDDSEEIYLQLKKVNESLSMINKEQGNSFKHIDQLNAEIGRLSKILNKK